MAKSLFLSLLHSLDVAGTAFACRWFRFFSYLLNFEAARFLFSGVFLVFSISMIKSLSSALSLWLFVPLIACLNCKLTMGKENLVHLSSPLWLEHPAGTTWQMLKVLCPVPEKCRHAHIHSLKAHRVYTEHHHLPYVHLFTLVKKKQDWLTR